MYTGAGNFLIKMTPASFWLISIMIFLLSPLTTMADIINLHFAAADGANSAILLYLKEHPDSINKLQFGKTALCEAVVNDKEKTVELLISKGADVNAGEPPLKTPIFAMLDSFVPISVDDRILDLLLKAGVNLKARTASGKTPLHIAVEERRKIFIEKILLAGAVLEVKDNKGKTPLAAAVMREKTGIVKLLLKHGANLEAQDKYGRTPLFYAVMNNDYNTIRLLMNEGANVHAKDKKGASILQLAKKNKKLLNFINRHIRKNRRK